MNVRTSTPSCMPMWPVHITGSSLELIQEAILHLTLQLVYSIHLWYWKSMLWSIDTCQNKVSADQYHVTISWAQVRPYRGQLFFFFWSWPLTRDWLLIGSQAEARSDTQTHTWTRLNFSRSFCGSTQVHNHATSAKLLAVDAFRVQVQLGKYIFLAFFAGFDPGLT